MGWAASQANTLVSVSLSQLLGSSSLSRLWRIRFWHYAQNYFLKFAVEGDEISNLHVSDGFQELLVSTVVDTYVLLDSFLGFLIDILEKTKFGVVRVGKLIFWKIIDACGPSDLSRPSAKVLAAGIAIFGCPVLGAGAEAVLPWAVDLHCLADILESQRVFLVDDAFKHIVKINNSLQHDSDLISSQYFCIVY